MMMMITGREKGRARCTCRLPTAIVWCVVANRGRGERICAVMRFGQDLGSGPRVRTSGQDRAFRSTPRGGVVRVWGGREGVRDSSVDWAAQREGVGQGLEEGGEDEKWAAERGVGAGPGGEGAGGEGGGGAADAGAGGREGGAGLQPQHDEHHRRQRE
eukprot:104340-Prorocentrum_minimum.AAC.1